MACHTKRERFSDGGYISGDNQSPPVKDFPLFGNSFKHVCLCALVRGHGLMRTAFHSVYSFANILCAKVNPTLKQTRSIHKFSTLTETE